MIGIPRRSPGVTIAGQTSPGGIIVRGFHTTEEPFIDQEVGRINDPDVRHAENWILRHIRSRPAGSGLDDGLRIRYTKNAIVDHCSIANADDETVEISFASNITVQNCIFAENISEHYIYGGMLINYTNPADGFPLDRLSIHHNTWNRIEGRMPELSRGSPAAGGTYMDIELANNLLWDPGYFIDVNQTTISGTGDGDPVYYHLNWIGNYAYARGDFPYGMIWFPVNDPNHSTIYFGDNRMNLYGDRYDYGLIYCCNDYPSASVENDPPSYARQARHPFPPITYQPSSGLRAYMQASAGAFPRDPMDRRLMGPVGTGVIDPAPRNRNQHHDAFAVDWTTPPPAPQDSDSDGMPDSWETAHGLDPTRQDHNGTVLSPLGYTNLEVYLNELAGTPVGDPALRITRVTSRKGAPGSSASILGSGFGADRSVVGAWFGSTGARVKGVTPAKIQVTVPRSLRRGQTVGVHVSVAGVPSNTVRFRVR
ncbi:MAG: IPT/TIG domain-containing protein [Acidobacteriota bacterium]